jgi:hypothetical protein
MFEAWAEVLRSMNVPRKKGWWTELWERGEAVASSKENMVET